MMAKPKATADEKKHPKDSLPIVFFASAEAWEAWLGKNHDSSSGLWVQLAKKASGIPSITYAEALDVALCYGWIDGQKAPFDDPYWLQRFTPRRPKSKWSKINVHKVAELTAQGKMQQAGLREVEAAKQDGRWDAAYESYRNITVPDDLREALDNNPRALEFFNGLDRTNRYAILYRIHDAKKPETRARRIAQFVGMLSEGKKLY